MRERDSAPAQPPGIAYESLDIAQSRSWYAARHGNWGPMLAAGYVERFRALVERNFSHRHRVSDYARDLRVSPGYLNALCRSQLPFERRSRGSARASHWKRAVCCSTAITALRGWHIFLAFRTRVISHDFFSARSVSRRRNSREDNDVTPENIAVRWKACRFRTRWSAVSIDPSTHAGEIDSCNGRNRTSVL